jgi:SAM-dependent methyltransferase
MTAERTKWRWVWGVAAGLFLANGLRLRLRARHLVTAAPDLDAEGAAVSAGGTSTGPRSDSSADGWRWLTAEGVVPDARLKAAVAKSAQSHGLEAVDVVPRDLPPERALELLRAVNPDTFRDSPFALGETALQAIAATEGLLKRAGLEAAGGLDPVSMQSAFRRLKRYAPTATDVLVSPGLRAAPEDSDKRMALLGERFGPFASVAILIPATHLAFLAGGLVLCPAWGGAALVSWCLQPTVALAGTPLRPHNLPWWPLLRWLTVATGVGRTAAGRWRPPPGVGSQPDPEALRPAYDELLSEGTGRFFDAPRPDCPMCGSNDLAVQVRCPDLLQRKPGRFVLERCGSCRHVFQNPRLSLEGLDFYYRDAYDGLGEGTMDMVFGFQTRAYRTRAATMDGRAKPRSWLDVGTGHGHFCLVAKDLWPETRFDGLDMGESVVEAERRGWVAEGHRGVLPDLARQLAGRYDVVSMSHYLEHTREPLNELEAAWEVLVPGGHLMIEVPDPDCIYSRLLGRYWLPWLQPQHQHLIPFDNLERALSKVGFEVVMSDQRGNRFTVDLTGALFLVLNQLAPSWAPWRPSSSRLSRIGRLAASALCAPVLLLTLVLDGLLSLIVRSPRQTNLYRVLARRPLLDSGEIAPAQGPDRP